MSKIQAELAKASGVMPESGQAIIDQAYLRKLVRAVANLADKDWNAISTPAQDWHNSAADAFNAKKEAPAFPDYVAEDPPARRRRSADDDEQPSTPKLAKGDKVTIVTSRDKEVSGEVVDPDDKGDLVLLVSGEEVAYDLAKLKKITKEAAEEAPARRRRSADDDEPQVVEPEVSDTVEIVNTRDKQYVGNIIEMDKEQVVIKTTTGDELEFPRAKIKSIVVKVKNAKGGSTKPADDAEDPPARRRSSGKDDDKGGDAKGGDEKKRTSKDENGGVSVTTRLREIMCEDPLNPLSLDELGKAIGKEGLKCNDSTMKMVHADCVKLFKLLAAGKHLK